MRSYQFSISDSTLYEVRATGVGREQLKPIIEAVGGTIDVYGSQEPVASPPSGMSINDEMENISIGAFTYLPSYLYVAVNTGDPEIVISGVYAEEYTDLIPLITELGGLLQSEDGEFIYA